MRRTVISLLFLSFLIPQVAMAAWWDPTTWFNNWTFKKNDPSIQILENRIKDLEEQIEFKNIQSEPSTSLSSEESVEESVAETKLIEELKIEKTPKIEVLIPVQPIEPAIVQKKINDQEVRCELSPKNSSIKRDDLVTARLSAPSLGLSHYDIVWDTENLKKINNFNEESYKFSTVGSKVISASVTRKDDGATGLVKCAGIIVDCDSFDCLDDTEKKIYKLDEIIDIVDSWYDDNYPGLSPADQCYIAESIVRAIEYEYTLMGGVGLPVFSRTVDCANDLAPKAYEHKVKVLRESLY